MEYNCKINTPDPDSYTAEEYSLEIERQTRAFCEKHNLDWDSMYPTSIKFDGLEYEMSENQCIVGNNKIWKEQQ